MKTKKLSFKESLRKFRDYGFTAEFMSDEEFSENVYETQWEFKTEDVFFTSQDFIY
jgi:hypothetical protein